MRKPKDIEITDQDDEVHTYVIHRIDAVAGREIMTQYPISNVPKLGDYKTSQELMFKLMGYVGVRTVADKPPLMLTTPALINNHIPDWECLIKVEAAMMEYNVSFFGNGKTSNFFGNIAANCQAWITSTLTGLLGQLLAQVKQPSTNSEPSTT